MVLVTGISIADVDAFVSIDVVEVPSCMIGSSRPVLAAASRGYGVMAINNLYAVVHDRGVRGGVVGDASVWMTVPTSNDFCACVVSVE